MIVIIDNYDSFTYNLVQYIGSLGKELLVVRNDQIDIDDIKKLNPEKIVISPGPGYPEEAGMSMQIIHEFLEVCPILGVCLGHQSIAAVLGAKIVPAKDLVHGKSSDIYHDGKTVYKEIPNPFPAGRYHSLVVDEASLPDCIEITARTQDNQIMGLRHKRYPVEGVQFHPESILTQNGMSIIKNFLNIS